MPEPLLHRVTNDATQLSSAQLLPILLLAADLFVISVHTIYYQKGGADVKNLLYKRRITAVKETAIIITIIVRQNKFIFDCRPRIAGSNRSAHQPIKNGTTDKSIEIQVGVFLFDSMNLKLETPNILPFKAGSGFSLPKYIS